MLAAKQILQMACLGVHHTFSALLDPLICTLGSIVKRPEQFIPRHFQRSIITFKIPMMHLMMKRKILVLLIVMMMGIVEEVEAIVRGKATRDTTPKGRAKEKASGKKE